MSTQVKRRRGTAAENAAFTGAIAEIAFLTDTNRIAIHNAVRAGGYLIPTADDLLNGALTRGTASGTDTYALTLPFFPSSYSAGLEIDVTFTNANTTSSTLNVNGVGATGLKDESGANFSAGQIAAGSRHTFRHNGTEFRRVSGAAGAVKTVSQQVFTASGTYTPSAGMLFCIVEVRGGGGGGGGAAGFHGGAAGGGGQGGYARERFSAATIGSSQTVTIGAGGTAGNTSPTNGGTGGTTSLGSLISATGGAGGIAGGSGSTLKLGGAGGSGSGGDINLTGQAGFNSVSTAADANSSGGNGGGEGGGRGGSASAGTAGSNGGGGGGASGNVGVAGGAGGAGYMIITEYCSQ